MNVFRSLQLAASAPVARERLQILLEYERKLGSQIDLFTVLREEILAVISRHIVDPEKVQVTFDRGAKFSTLGVNIELPHPGGKARTLPTDCAVLQRDKTVGTRMQGADAAAETLAPPIWLVGGTVGAIVAVVLGAWLYAQQSDDGKRRPLDDRETALMAGFEEQVNAPRPAEGVVAATGPSVVLPRMRAPGTVGSLPRDAAAPEPVSQSAAITPLDAPGSDTSSPQDPPPAAAEPVLQSAAVTGSVTSSPHEPPPVAAEPVLQSAGVTGSVTSSPREPPPAAAEPGGGPRSLEVEEQRRGLTLGTRCWIGASYTKGGGMETVVGAIAIAFVLWWLAEEFQQIARRNRALEFVHWWRRRGANLLSLRELIGEDRRVIAQHRELH
jgi:cell division topological specificity factor